MSNVRTNAQNVEAANDHINEAISLLINVRDGLQEDLINAAIAFQLSGQGKNAQKRIDFLSKAIDRLESAQESIEDATT